MGSTPYHTIDSYNGKPLDGVVRLNGSNFEYWDGNMWNYLPDNNVTVQMDPVIADWVNKKMEEEQRIERLVKQFPALKTAKENYDTILALVKSEEREDAA